MSDALSNVIGQKIESARRVNTPLPRVSDVLSEMNKLLEKQLRAYLGSVVEAMILDIEAKIFSDVLDSVSMPAMLGIIEIDGLDRAALVNMDLDLVYHIVDLRMGGSPAEHPEFGARRPTAIDNALCTPAVDMALEGFAHGLMSVFGATEAIPMRCTGFEHLPMLASITGERADVLSVKVSLDIGEAARSGDFELVIPFSTLDVIKGRLKETADVSASAANDAWAAHMMDVVLGTEIDLTPVVFTTHFSVADIARFEVGAVIELEPGAHQAVELTLDAPGAPLVLTKAKLGAFKGQKALKLADQPDPTFLAPIRTLAERRGPL